MNQVIKELTERRDKLKADYNKFVIEGNVDYNSPAAKQNREWYNQFDKAIKILSANAETSERQLTIPDVIKSVCPACGSKYYDEDNNVKRCQDCYTIY